MEQLAVGRLDRLEEVVGDVRAEVQLGVGREGPGGAGGEGFELTAQARGLPHGLKTAPALVVGLAVEARELVLGGAARAGGGELLAEARDVRLGPARTGAAFLHLAGEALLAGLGGHLAQAGLDGAQDEGGGGPGTGGSAATDSRAARSCQRAWARARRSATETSL